jgi:hypothetical protein
VPGKLLRGAVGAKALMHMNIGLAYRMVQLSSVETPFVQAQIRDAWQIPCYIVLRCQIDL